MSLLNYPDYSIGLTTLTGWTQSPATSTEYYYATDAKHEPLLVTEDGTPLIAGTLGSLAIGEWAWGDQDSLGYDTIYARVTGDVDPDTLTMKGSLALTLATVTASHSLGIMSIEMCSRELADAKNIRIIRTNTSDVEFFRADVGIPASDTVIFDHGICLAATEKLKVMCDSENIAIVVNANDITNV